MRADPWPLLHRKYHRYVWWLAHRISNGHPAWTEDLAQEGFARLAALDLTGARRNLQSYVRQAIKFAMIDAQRYLRYDRYCSFEQAWYEGWNFDIDASGHWVGSRVDRRRRKGRLPKELRLLNW